MSANRRTFRIGFVNCPKNVGIVCIVNVRKRGVIARFQTAVRKRGMIVKENSCNPKSKTIAMIVWSNILRQQSLLGITDEQLCEVMGVTSRSLYNYRKAPSVMTMKQIQKLLDSFGVDMQTLIMT